MRVSPDAAAVQSFLARVSRRARITGAMRGASTGLAAALAVGIIVMLAPVDASAVAVVLVLAIAGLVAGAVTGWLRAPASAPLVEQRAPQSKNIVLTSAELAGAPTRVPPHIAGRVHADAERVVRTLDPARLLPAGRAALALISSTLAWIATVAVLIVVPEPGRSLPGTMSTITGAPLIHGIDITIVPPSYAGREEVRVPDPARIEALAGSELRVIVRAAAATVTAETIAGRDTLTRTHGEFGGTVLVDADGYLAIEATATDGRSTRRLIGITATPDRLPIVRIPSPGEDLTFPDGTRTIDVSVEAADDIGLRSLALAFTHVSGSGEQHEFSEGEVVLDIARDSARGWRGRGVLRLDTLNLQPGDMVVYRALARDARERTAATESDAYIVSVAAPGDIPAEGYSSDEEDRYALSQQMVLLKTERLIARAPSMPADSVQQVAAEIAAEQRAVRAEFVFMMGGELAEEVAPEASMEDLNEEAHADLVDEAIAGRLRNRGRAELLAAIRAMSRANTALIDVDLAGARTAEREAIDRLQSAFSRTRYILRALTQRERLDLSRRLTGDLTEVGRTTRPSPEAEPSARVTALRKALADVAALGGDASVERSSVTSAAALDVLRIDPASDEMRTIAARLDSAALAFDSGDDTRAGSLLDRAALALADAVRAELGRAPAASPGMETSRLRGALTDALRRVPR